MTDSAPSVDLSGRYVYDPASTAYPKLGVSYFPFIAPDTVPFSVINVDQDNGNTLIIRYQADYEGTLTEKEKRYDLRDKSFRFEHEHLVFRSKADHRDFAVVWGKRTTTIKIHKNANGDLVFDNRQTIKSLAIPIFPVFSDTTHTGMVVLAAAGTNAPLMMRSEPELNGRVPTR